MKKKILIAFVVCQFFLLFCSCSLTGKNIENNQSDCNYICKLNCISAKPIVDKSDKKNNINDKNDIKDYTPLNFEHQRGIWISYIDLEPMLTGKTEEEFTNNFNTACKNISEMGFNTIYVHVRPFADAIYNSELFPPSRYLTGTVGEYGDFDALEIMIETAHKYNLSVHGWINPLRCENENDFSYIPQRYKIRQWYDNMDNNDMIRKVKGDSHLWLNPAYKEVRSFIAEGVKEITENYNIDGIHYDDYFYPTTDKDFDSNAYAKFGQNKELGNWRRENISEMVKQIYQAVKDSNKKIIVGISPQGNNDNNYNKMYADVQLWGSEQGYADYIEPQLYFGYNNSVKPFLQTLAEWEKIVSNKNVNLVIGLGAYKIFEDDEFKSEQGIISNQIKDSFKENCGIGIYTYNSLFKPSDEFAQRIESEKNNIRDIFQQ